MSEVEKIAALREVRAIALSHSNYGHIEGNWRAFAIIADLDRRIDAIERHLQEQSK